MNSLPFRTLLYRYFFFGWLFRDIDAAENIFQRSAVLRHNHQQAVWLPLYMLRWTCVGMLLFGVGDVLAAVAGRTGVNLFFVAAGLCLAFAVATGVAWMALRRAPL